MTLYMTCFVKWSISDRLTPNLAQLCIRPHICHKTNDEDIGAIMLMLWMSYGHCSHNVDVMDVLWSL